MRGGKRASVPLCQYPTCCILRPTISSVGSLTPWRPYRQQQSGLRIVSANRRVAEPAHARALSRQGERNEHETPWLARDLRRTCAAVAATQYHPFSSMPIDQKTLACMDGCRCQLNDKPAAAQQWGLTGMAGSLQRRQVVASAAVPASSGLQALIFDCDGASVHNRGSKLHPCLTVESGICLGQACRYRSCSTAAPAALPCVLVPCSLHLPCRRDCGERGNPPHGLQCRFPAL